MAKTKNGWVSLHRALLDNPIFEDATLLKTFIWCLLKATHEERIQIVGRQEVKISPGQFITGRHKAGKELGLSPSKAREQLIKLQIANTLDIKSNNKFSLVTIENWDFYQNTGKKLNSKSNSISDSKPNSVSDTNNNINKLNKSIVHAEVVKLWELFPNKKGKADAMKKIPKLIEEYGFDALAECITRYKETKEDWKAWMMGSTFFNGRYQDYLDENFEPKGVNSQHAYSQPDNGGGPRIV